MHHNEAHHGKEPMDDIGGTNKKLMFRQIRSGQIIINLAEDFCKVANQFSSSITTLFQKLDVILSDPSDIEEAPIIPGALKIHMFTRIHPTATGENQTNRRNLVSPKSMPPKKMQEHKP